MTIFSMCWSSSSNLRRGLRRSRSSWVWRLTLIWLTLSDSLQSKGSILWASMTSDMVYACLAWMSQSMSLPFSWRDSTKILIRCSNMLSFARLSSHKMHSMLVFSPRKLPSLCTLKTWFQSKRYSTQKLQSFSSKLGPLTCRMKYQQSNLDYWLRKKLDSLRILLSNYLIPTMIIALTRKM